jgi:hypothetical protein
MSEQIQRSREQIVRMITETELTILDIRDANERFSKKYPQETLERNRQRIAIHEAILSLLKDIERKARP